MKIAPLPLLLGLVLAALSTFFIWAHLAAPVDMVDAPSGKVRCVSYTPYRDNETPFNPDYVADPARIDSDLAMLSQVTSCVRTYSVKQGLDQVVPAAEKHGMQVLLGIWIGREEKGNQQEIAQAIAVANAHPKTIRAIIIGNEVLLRGEQQPDDLIRYLKQVKAATGLPVTYADVTDFWMKAPKELADAVDFITIHILPYWENNPTSAEGGVAYLKSVREEVAAEFPGKRIFIGETGFPSAGRERAEAVPSIVAQARYLRELAVYADSIGLDYNLIEAFDQPWKRALEGTAGGHWGLFTTDRELKFPETGPVTNYPHWQREAGAAFAISLFALLMLAWRGNVGGMLPGIAAGIGSALAGTALVLQAEHSWLAWRSPLEATVELLVFLQSLAVIIVVLPEVARGERAVAPLPIARTVAWLRAPRRSPFDRAHALGLVQLSVTASMLVISLGLSFDNRYRDFPNAAYAIAVGGFVLLALQRGDYRRAPEGRREEALFALLLALNAVAIAFNEGPQNIQALIWCALNLLFALPWLAVARTAWRRTFRNAAAATA
ncbi:MAG: beta-(1-6) glucans synthase [Parvibaculum sp.]|uniref:glycoside hydrolase family 17 protein n=1 Tax=Parvibaculum sp. TaxID=2024848 RepID=UPI002843DF73|nr:beta-(1-6) glucans synthase [Parvibaculum sp.]MDR3499622.1 beta-(1-6) glucans synthase [Parvibaculum sp.]